MEMVSVTEVTQAIRTRPQHGCAYLYAGQELGLPQVDLPEEYRRDPQDPINCGVGSRGRPGRDGTRVPLPWAGSGDSLGFAPGGVSPFAPQPPAFRDLAAERQAGDPGSYLSRVRDALALRGRLGLTRGRLAEVTGADGVLTARVETRGSRTVLAVCALGEQDVALPAGRRLLSTVPAPGDRLPAGEAAWIAPGDRLPAGEAAWMPGDRLPAGEAAWIALPDRPGRADGLSGRMR